MRRINQTKRKFIILLSCIMLFSSIMSSFSITVFADSTDRRAAYINMAKGKTLSEISDINSLTPEELRLIGVFLSNFYVPFSSTLSESTSDDEVKSDMATALAESANFDKDVAQVLVEYVWSMSLATAKPLYVGVTEEDGTVRRKSESTDSSNTNGSLFRYPQMGSNGNERVEIDALWLPADTTGTLASYFAFMTFFGGGTHKGDAYTNLWEVFEGKQFCLYWDDNGESKVVFQSSRYGVDDGGSSSKMIKEFSASTASYAMINDNLNYSNGYGSSLTSVGSMDEFDALSTEDKETVGIINSQLYVDCFGNILLDTGAQHFVVLPACANPYVWYDTDKGEDSLGSEMNLVNLFALGEAESDHLHRDDSNYYLDFYTGGGSLFNLKCWRMYYNNSEYKVDDTIWDSDSDKDRKALAKSLKSYLGQTENTWGSDNVVFQNWNNYGGAFDANETDKITPKKNYKTGYTVSTANVIDDMIFFDSLNKYEEADTEDSTYSAFKTTDYGIFKKNSNYVSLTSGLTGITSNISSTKLNKVTTVANAKIYVVNVFASYVFAYYEKDGSHVKFAYSDKNIPDVSNVDLSNLTVDVDSNYQGQQLQSMIYYFLHPTEGITYVATWFKNKVGGILVGWHEDMVGNASTSSTTGSTKYIGFSGYVTVPNLHDIEWTDWLLNQYDNLLVYFIVLIAVVMMGYTMIGSISLQKAILSIILFAVCSYLPPIMINFMVDTSNSVCDSIYGNKFTYWALVQHEQYISSINSAIANGDESNYLVTLFEQNVEDSSSTSNVVTLKWMSPKKDNYLANIQSELYNTSKSNAISKFLGGRMSEEYSGEDYIDKADSLYLYRSYTDISSYSSTYYNKMTLGTTQLDNIVLDSGENLNTIYEDYTSDSTTKPNSLSLATSISRGFNFDTNTASGTWDSATNKRFYPALTSKDVSDAIEDGLDNLMIDMDSSSLAGIPQNSFNTTIADFNGNNADAKESGLASFGVYTESPFYYFSWNVYDQMNSGSDMATSVLSGAIHPYKNLFSMTDGGYFYNLSGDEGTSGYGDMRDYMDMRSLFTLIIPYLKSANDVVVDWDNKYGLTFNNDIDLEYDSDNNLIVPQEVQDAGKDSELYYNYWHNANVAQLFNMYSPWIDTMYDCNYAKGQYISVMGERFFVKDPLDPSSYYKTDTQGNIIEGRQMIFSESEMKYWGLTKADLTSVEVKILEVEEESYSDLLQLMDYYTFNEDVLNTAAAMIETFNFNKVFSETSIYGEDYIMYPQSYELKNFSYDAYLRLILSGSTGEDLQSSDNESIYTRLVQKSSITTGLALIILDMFAVYAIPALKFFFIIAIFLMSILMILSATVRLEINIATVLRESLLSPLLKFLGISIGMAWVVSLFMSNGNTAITGRSKTVISLGDPVMVLLVMIVINVVVLVLYFKTAKKVAKDCVKYAKAIGSSAVGMVGGITALAGGIIAGKTSSIGVGKSGVSTGASSNANVRGEENKPNKAMIKSNKQIAKSRQKQQKYNDSAYKAEKKVNKFENRQMSIDERIAKGQSKIDNQGKKLEKAKKSNGQKNIELAERRLKSSEKSYTNLQKKQTSNSRKLVKAQLKSNVKSKRAGGKKSI